MYCIQRQLKNRLPGESKLKTMIIKTVIVCCFITDSILLNLQITLLKPM